MTAPVVVLRALLLVLPCAALALALPQVPHGLVVAGVVLSAAAWAWLPDHAVGVVPLALVGGLVDGRTTSSTGGCWWSACCSLAAHVAATLVSYGPATLASTRAWPGCGCARGGAGAGPAAGHLAGRPRPRPATGARRGCGSSPGATAVGLLVVTARLIRPEER